jgi:FMN-dependent NADH-azoreductase
MEDYMATVLYVTCNLKPVDESHSLFIGREFIDQYVKQNPNDRIEQIDVYRDPIQRIDADVLSGWKKLQQGQGFENLTDEESRKVMRISNLADQFIAADKYVFVTPMWNLGFPAELKMYIDTVCVVGKTFEYTEQGAVGLLQNMGKKCLHIHSSGGFHFGLEEDHSVPYLRSILKFMGVEDFRAVVLEGVEAMPHMAADFTQKAISQCREVANSF